MECQHEKDKVEALVCDFWNKDQNGIKEHNTWISGWRCKCGKNVLPETYKEISSEEGEE